MNGKYPQIQIVKIGKRRYMVTRHVLFDTGINIKKSITSENLIMYENGRLYIKRGFTYDGPSGPAIDTVDTMTAACVHDALYKLILEDKLPFRCRKYADWLLMDIMIAVSYTHLRAHET